MTDILNDPSIVRPALIALDLDGTLLSPDKSISPANIAAVAAARAAGIEVLLASGRMHSATVRYAKQLDFAETSYIISYNGALARTVGGEVLLHDPVTSELCGEIIDLSDELAIHLNIYLDDTLYNTQHDAWTDLYYSRTGSVAQIIGSFETLRAQRPTKMLWIANAARIAELLPQMKERFAGRLHVLRTDDEYLEFMAPTVDKRYALEAVANHQNIARERCAAFGDNSNDLGMIEWSGVGIAMANARPVVLAAAAWTAPSNEEDGVAQVIGKFLR